MSDTTAKAFTRKWAEYLKFDPEKILASKKWEMETHLGLYPQDLSGKDVLDAGCGTGYSMRYVSSYAKSVTGFDIIDPAIPEQILRGIKNTEVRELDIYDAPYKIRKKFDLIYSMGVLHHCPDPRAAFECLLKMLRPGGRIAIWVYKRNDYDIFHYSNQGARFITSRLPVGVLWYLCYILNYVGYVPVLRSFINSSNIPDRKLRHLLNFDGYSPRYNSMSREGDVYRWFIDNGIEIEKILDQKIGIIGRKHES